MTCEPAAWVEIDLDAIASNLRVLKALTPFGCLFMVVVKGDAYGHGAVPVAREALAAGANRLGVATVDEAVKLRAAGITAPVHLLSEPPPRPPRLSSSFTSSPRSSRGISPRQSARPPLPSAGRCLSISRSTPA